MEWSIREGLKRGMGGEVCCDFDKKEVNDIGFLRELMGRIETDYHVDLKRVHFAGHSNGGFMSFRMAMEYPELIASIAAISGTMDQVSTLPPPSGPVNILRIHGTSDEVVSIMVGRPVAGFPLPEVLRAPTKFSAAGLSGMVARTSSKKLSLPSIW